MTRYLLISASALGLCMAAPAAVADATAEKAINDLINNPLICGPGGQLTPTASTGEIIMVDGFGTGGFRVDTLNPEAQAWFNHGVRLRWAFQHSESVRAFQKARRLDPTCGMCAWGEAWAMGPNLNGGGSGEETARKALDIAREARRMVRDSTQQNKLLVDALIQRYSGREDSRAKRFAQHTERLADRFPDHIGLQSIAADALMLVDYDWWDEDGKAKSREIAKAMTVLERTLAKAPDDPGSIHLYIHLTEWSDDPHKAIPYGERLAALAPGASHLVHMPSHTFYRVGRYRDAMNSNINAVALDKRYDQLARPPGGVSGMPLHAHNIHFGMGGALMAGAGEEGIKLADWFFEVFSEIAPDNTWRQAMTANAYALYGRFGTPEQVAGLKDPGEARPLQRLMWRYARGEAAARAGDAAAVRAELAEMDGMVEAIKAGMPAGNPFANAFTVLPTRILAGRAAMLDGDWAAAQTAFREAAEIQEAADLMGGDPPPWWYPARRSLAAALLAAGDADGAIAEAEKVIADEWPDPSTYFVMAQAAKAKGDEVNHDRWLAQSKVEWIGAERDWKQL